MTVESSVEAAAQRMANAPDLSAEHFNDHGAAERHLELRRWGGAPACPRCLARAPYEYTTTTRTKFSCRKSECRYQFSVISYTIMRNTKTGLCQWLRAEACLKAGLSSNQAAALIGVAPDTSWELYKRIKNNGGKLF